MVECLPNAALKLHTRPFESRALILDGEIALTLDGIETIHRAGEIFHLPREMLHAERDGAAGVRYLVGRK
jgi:quercetin dioxygenase-like cupin family protein